MAHLSSHLAALAKCVSYKCDISDLVMEIKKQFLFPQLHFNCVL